MSRLNAVFGLGLVAFCGIATAFATWQPELEKQRAERAGEFQSQHTRTAEGQEEAPLRKAILSDLEAARVQVEGEGKGIAWGIREAIWGKKEGKGAQAQQPKA